MANVNPARGNIKGRLFLIFVLVAIPWALVSNWMTSRENQQSALKAQEEAKRKAEAQALLDAAFKAISPEQHLVEASKAIEASNLTLAFRHLGEVPKPNAKREALEGLAQKAKMKMEAEHKKAMAEEARAKMESPGEKPDMIVLMIALRRSIKQSANDPDSVTDPELAGPFPTQLRLKDGKVGCWRIPYQFRAKNMFGGLILKTGTVWFKDGGIIKDEMY